MRTIYLGLAPALFAAVLMPAASALARGGGGGGHGGGGGGHGGGGGGFHGGGGFQGGGFNGGGMSRGSATVHAAPGGNVARQSQSFANRAAHNPSFVQQHF